ncbi:MAG: ABC transporter ATP-binding protein [Ruminococcaceae bacterium]|nr:ABC transporter ATP-binding protein [Oscillospiraceae bacterium]
MSHIIKIENLIKRYGEISAVDNLSFTVEKGELFAFLGVNGAGKSTTINVMCGQLKKDGGKVEIDGVDTDKNSDDIGRKLGVVFQSSVLDKPLSVYDNLESRGALYGIRGDALKKRINELASLLEFEDILKRPVGKLSGGQRRRIDVARALIHKPKILILDEPTTGLDPQTRKRLWEVIHNLRKEEEMTVFLTTHYMEEASDADHIVILDKGKIVSSGTPLELKNKYAGDFITLYGVSEDEVKLLGTNAEKLKDGYRISVRDTSEATALILKHPEIFRDFEITKGKMDDVFLASTGKLLGGDEE